MTRGSFFRLVCPGALLVIGLTVVSWGNFASNADQVPFVPDLPQTIGGWVGEEMPLENALVAETTVRLLNYDRYVHRRYRKNGQEVFVYAMVWRQGRISVREMAGHTPDGCWPANGAVLLDADSSIRTTSAERISKPAEFCHFRFPGGGQVNVWWWQVWGDRIVPRSFARKSVLTLWEEIRVWLFTHRTSRAGHMLIRVHAPDSLPGALQTEPVQAFLGSFAAVWEGNSVEGETRAASPLHSSPAR
jgi:hypothetical protein